MTSALENLCGSGKPLVAEPPDRKEFDGLKRAGLARMNDAAHPEISLDGRFDLAYNAAHAIRNIAEYEGELEIDERIAADLLAACRAVADKLEHLPPMPG